MVETLAGRGKFQADVAPELIRGTEESDSERDLKPVTCFVENILGGGIGHGGASVPPPAAVIHCLIFSTEQPVTVK